MRWPLYRVTTIGRFHCVYMYLPYNMRSHSVLPKIFKYQFCTCMHFG